MERGCNVQSKFLYLVLLEAISCYVLLIITWEKTNPHLATGSFQGVVESQRALENPEPSSG